MPTKIYRVIKPISVDAGMTFSLCQDEIFEFCNSRITKLTYQCGSKKHELKITRHTSNLIYYNSWVTLDSIIKLGGIIEDITEQILRARNRDRKINDILE